MNKRTCSNQGIPGNGWNGLNAWNNLNDDLKIGLLVDGSSESSLRLLLKLQNSSSFVRVDSAGEHLSTFFAKKSTRYILSDILLNRSIPDILSSSYRYVTER